MIEERRRVRTVTTREESEILERDKVYEADRTLFEPYFRHVQNQLEVSG